MGIKNLIAEVVAMDRKSERLSQEKYGLSFGVSGPAILKIEKGQMRPGLDLWCRMAWAMGISDRKAVLMWLREGLPADRKRYIDLASAIQEVKTSTLPRGLRELYSDKKWNEKFHPTPREFELVEDKFHTFKDASCDFFRRAFDLFRTLAQEVK